MRPVTPFMTMRTLRVAIGASTSSVRSDARQVVRRDRARSSCGSASSSRRRAGDVHPAEVEHAADVGGLQGPPGVLLDEQHGRASVAHAHDLLEDRARRLRVEAHGRLVEEHHLGADHERPGELHLLLLAAGEQPGERLPPLADDGEEVLHEGDPLVDDAPCPAPCSAPRRTFSATVISRNTLCPCRTCASPEASICCGPLTGDVLAVDQDPARARRRAGRWPP